MNQLERRVEVNELEGFNRVDQSQRIKVENGSSGAGLMHTHSKNNGGGIL